jgi:hypothetical protein
MFFETDKAFQFEAILKAFCRQEKAGYTDLTFAVSLFYEESKESFPFIHLWKRRLSSLRH